MDINCKNSMYYTDAIKYYGPFDLVLFKGADFISNSIRFFENKELGNGDFSHAGFIVTSDVLPDIRQLEENKLYIIESTMSYSLGGFTDGVPDIITNKGKFGCQIRDLDTVINAYTKTKDTKVAFCKLLNNPWDNIENRKQIIDEMRILFKKYCRRRYELNPLELFAAIFPSLRPYRDIFNEIIIDGYKVLHASNVDSTYGIVGWQFCSELVAQIYQNIGVLSKTLPPEDFVPIDFIGYNKDRCQKIVEEPVYIIPND